jgi:TolA-binding protein
MRRISCILVLCILVSAAAAGGGRQEMTAPQILPAQVKAVSVVDESKAASNDVVALHDYLLKLKAEREALAIEQTIAQQQIPAKAGVESQDITQMRQQMADLVKKLGVLNATKKGVDSTGRVLMPTPGLSEKNKQGELNKQKQMNPEKNPGKVSPQEMLDVGVSADPRALASVLFKAGNFEFALKAFRTVNSAGMRPDERAPIQYLMASCLRKMGKVDEAAALYREVANTRGDEQVAACAQWQLVYLRWRSEFEAQLKDLQERCKALEGPS